MQRSDFVGLGRMLYGEHWMQPMADLMDVTARTIRRWVLRDQLLLSSAQLSVLALTVQKDRARLDHEFDKRAVALKLATEILAKEMECLRLARAGDLDSSPVEG